MMPTIIKWGTVYDHATSHGENFLRLESRRIFTLADHGDVQCWLLRGEVNEIWVVILTEGQAQCEYKITIPVNGILYHAPEMVELTERISLERLAEQWRELSQELEGFF